MQKLITYTSSIPPVPESIINTFDEILSMPDAVLMRTTTADYSKWVKDGTVPNLGFKMLPEQLNSWAQQNIPFPCKAFGWYIMIYEHVIKHRDYSKETPHRIGLNYLLHTGGNDCVTHLYDNNEKPIQSIKIKERTWHKIPLDVLHNVENITDQPRVVLRVFPEDHVKWEDII